MDRPIYEDDLTTIHARHAAPLVRLRDRAATSLVHLSTAACEDRMQAALTDLEDVAAIIGALFTDGEISEPDVPFGEVRMAWIGGKVPCCIKIGDSVENPGLDDAHALDTDASSSIASAESDNSGDEDSDSEMEDASWSEESDPGVDSLSLMDLASKCSTTTFTDLRRLYALYYTIHIHRIDRLLLRLAPNTPIPVPTTIPTIIPPNRPETPVRQPPPPPPGAVINQGQAKGWHNSGGAGAPLTEDRETQYALVLADEIARVAEYKQAIVSVLIREIAGAVGVV
ncbi:hypothetical protein UCDDS831_g00927 [Diplodia seriata]|uniref:Uncharacterized protein n=1 Tax=Diplodia seriata TaxID=420778 RepID=A0A0G2HFC2_9PEZI|nr:hypothetical protein UCDDS831_g00927 [Diplodia seriata]